MGSLRQLAHKLAALDPDADPIRQKTESEVLDKLWRMGILKQSREQGAGLSRIEKEVTVSAFCRRRLAVVMARSGMVENIKTVCITLLTLLFVCFISPRWLKCVEIWLLIHLWVDRQLHSSSKAMCVLGQRL